MTQDATGVIGERKSVARKGECKAEAMGGREWIIRWIMMRTRTALQKVRQACSRDRHDMERDVASYKCTCMNANYHKASVVESRRAAEGCMRLRLS